MEQLIIFLLLALGSIISTYLQKKKREAEEGRGPGAPTGPPAIPHWPKTSRDWQEELRRLLQGENAPTPQPPPIPIPQRPLAAPLRPPAAPGRPTISRSAAPPTPQASEGSLVFESPLKQSATAYIRATQLQGRVERRMEAVDRQTRTHQAAPASRRTAPSSAAIVKRWTQNPESVREAFIASLIFDRPVSMQDR